MADRLYIAVPCFNEQEVLEETAKQLLRKLNDLISEGLIAPDSRILFVDDGSRDHTWSIIRSLYDGNERIAGLRLTRNKGHQNALLAGLMTAMEFADMVISMDADLQDDIDAVDEMLTQYYAGCDIVYGVRSDRVTDTAFKRATAQGFYRFMSLLGVQVVYNHADYRLMSRRALEGLARFGEANLFLRGIVPLIGYRTGTVEYARRERFAGESKYPLRKMIAFALDGITSFSVKPIRLVTLVGFVVFLMSIFFAVYSIVRRFTGATVPGWSTLMVSIWALGGLQLLALGVIGEYIGKIYNEVKARPRFLIEQYLDRQKKDPF